MYKFALLFLLIPTQLYAAEFYQCKDEKGRSQFSQTPCEEGAKKQYVNEPASNTEESRKKAALLQRKDQLRRELIPNQYTKIVTLRAERDEKIVALKEGGESSETPKMITERYEGYIEKERALLKQYKEEMASINVD